MLEKNNMAFSVLMSIYKKEKVAYFQSAMESILNQSLQADEIVLVKDGPLTAELDEAITVYVNKYSTVKIVSLHQNVGLGLALQAGLKECSSDIIARMDSNDIARTDRFLEQITYLAAHPEVSAVGSTIEEFNYIPADCGRFRKVPLEPAEIIKFAKRRNPINHMSVVFRKKDIESVGSYRDMPLFEDYYLWIRLLNSGYKLANLPAPLIWARVENGDMVGRRHGFQYLKHEINFLRTIYRTGFINGIELSLMFMLKLPARVLPKKILMFIYKHILR